MHRAVMAAFSLLIPLSMGSVPYRCQQGAFDGVSLFSVDLESQDDVAGCQTHCDAVPACISLAVEGTTCEVFGKNAVMKAEVNSTACTKAPQLSFACTEGAVYAESPLFSLADVPSLEACQQECSNFVGTCNAISMHGDGVCDILAAPSLTVPAPNASACAVAQPAFTCTSDAGLSEGTLLSLLADIASVEDCQAQCQHSQDCAAVQYTHATSTCELKANDARQEPRAGSTACIRSTTAPRAGGPGEVAYVGFEMGLHIAGLTPQVFDTLDTPVNTSEQTSVLRVATHVKVPVGIAPELFELTVHNTVAGELAKPDNTFARKLDPVLRTLGLHPLGNSPRSLGGVWSLAAASTLWKPQASEILTLSLVFEFSSSVDVETDGGRRALAALLAFEVGLPVSSVSFEEVLWCADRFGYVDCERKWAAAAPSAGQGREGQVLGAPQSKKVVTTFEVPANGTAADFCHNATQALPCDKNTSSVLVQRYGLQLCGQCDEDEGGAPVDDTYNTLTSAATSRTLLQTDDEGSSRRAAGLSHTPCTEGWQLARYGVMSEAFAIDIPPLQGTLLQCVAACTVDNGCYAFTRDTGVKDDDIATCLFRGAVLTASGDEPGRNGLATYVVACPGADIPCSWHYAEGYNVDTNSSQTVATSSAECTKLCEQLGTCNGVSYDRTTGACAFLKREEHNLVQDDGFVTAICHRRALETPCDSNSCGLDPSSTCLPLQHDYQCLCANGFACVGNCNEPHKPHTCERSMSLASLFHEAVQQVLRLDALAIKVEVTAGYESVTPPAPSKAVLVEKHAMQVPSTHIFSLTFDATTPDILLEVVGNSTRIELFARQVAQSLGVDTVAVKHLCQLARDGSTLGCVDENNAPTMIESLRPKVKDYVSRNYQGAIDWCASADPTVVAEPKSQSEVQQLVFRASGGMLETRSYWVGATCDESCSNADNWSWQNAPGVQVDWTELKHRDAELKDDLACAVLRWDSQNVEWRLVPVSCESGDYYPVCLMTGSPAEQDYAAECEADKSCDLKVSFEVELERVRDVVFVTIDGEARKYHPVDSLPAGLPLLTDERVSLGVVDSNGKTTAISFPPVDTTANAALKQLAPGYTYISETLTAFLRSGVSSWAEAAGITPPVNGVCHEGIQLQHVSCAGYNCALVDPLYMQHTSCQGAPPCLNTVCSGHGYAQGFMGQCSCRCSLGYSGDACGMCAAGFEAYPECRLSDGAGAVTLVQVVSLSLDTSGVAVKRGREGLRQDLDTSIGHMGSFSVRYLCPRSACEPIGVCDQLVNTWPSEARARCALLDDYYNREAAILDGTHDRSVVEVVIEHNRAYSARHTGLKEELMEALLMYVDQSTGTFSKLRLTDVVHLFGPSAESIPDVTPAANEDALVDEVKVGNAGLQELEPDSPIEWFMLMLVALLCTFVCCVVAVVICFRVGRKDKVNTKSLMKEQEDEVGDFLTVLKGEDEAMGIMWDDHTLMVGVCEGSAAERCGGQLFTGRRVARVNGMKVQRLSDIREESAGLTRVHLEFEPKYSSMVLRLDLERVTAEGFDQDHFLVEFADRVADALRLMEFSSYDVEVRSSFDKPERGETHLTLKLHGLTSDQVATVVALCVTPGEAIRSGLPIIGAFLAGHRGFSAAPPLWVSCQWMEEAAGAAGCYVQAPGKSSEGLPVWQHAPADHWLYASPDGFWVVVNDEELIGASSEEVDYVLRSVSFRNGLAPHLIAGGWRTPARHDADILVTAEEPRVHEFVVGQKVVFPEDVSLEDDLSFIKRRSEALVVAAAGELVKVCLLNPTQDIITVSPEVVDSADGPRIMVKDGKSWQAATIVKVKENAFKVHFDCGLCQDRWLDRTADRKKIRCTPEATYTVGDRVVLVDGADDEEDCLGKGVIGVVLACGDLGQAKPYLIEGPDSMAWYPTHKLARYTAGSAPFPEDVDVFTLEPETPHTVLTVKEGRCFGDEGEDEVGEDVLRVVSSMTFDTVRSSPLIQVGQDDEHVAAEESEE